MPDIRLQARPYRPKTDQPLPSRGESIYERNVAAATQNQALSALLFLYKHVLGQELPWMEEIVRAQRPVRLPVVLSEAEVRRLLEQMEGGARLMAGLLYGRACARSSACRCG